VCFHVALDSHVGQVVGFFGFNLTLPIYDPSDNSQYYFYAIVGFLTVFMVLSIVATVFWMKKKEFLVFHESFHDKEERNNIPL